MHKHDALTVCADPPWGEHGGGKIKRGADRHYPLMKSADILVLLTVQIPPTCRFLWMWATTSFLADAIGIGRDLGFRYVTGRVWVKPSVGLGQHVRMRHEHLLLFRRGLAYVPVPELRPDSVIEEPRRRHSQKPDSVYEQIRASYPGPHLELFAIGAREGWETWGNGQWDNNLKRGDDAQA